MPNVGVIGRIIRIHIHVHRKQDLRCGVALIVDKEHKNR